MIGDHVKGKLALNNYPDEVRKGIMLHRKIDMFTDDHPASQRAKLLFKDSTFLLHPDFFETVAGSN